MRESDARQNGRVIDFSRNGGDFTLHVDNTGPVSTRYWVNDPVIRLNVGCDLAVCPELVREKHRSS